MMMPTLLSAVTLCYHINRVVEGDAIDWIKPATAQDLIWDIFRD
jgi:hypothetical protein